MKIVKRIILVLVVLLVLALLIALFTKKDYSIERSIVINKPRAEVFNYIKYIENHQNFNKWMMMDLHVKSEHRGTDGTVGYVKTWDSENREVGKGEQEIKAIDEGRALDIELRFIEPFEGVGSSRTLTSSVTEDQTKVTTIFKGSMPYPANIMMLFMDIENMLGKDIEATLNNLKGVMENKPTSVRVY